MKRKSAEQRTIEFTEKKYIIKELDGHLPLSNDIKEELLLFWTHWLNDNPKTEPTSSLYFRICKLIKSSDLNFYQRHKALLKLKPHTLEHYICLFGQQTGKQKYHDRTRILSQKIKLTNIEDKLDAFFSLKKISACIKRSELSGKKIRELSNLLSAFDWQVFHDRWHIVLNIIQFSSDNFVNRFSTVISKNHNSTEYLMARYGDNVNYIQFLKNKKSQEAKQNFGNCIDYWKKRGFTYEESLTYVSDTQRARSKKANIKGQLSRRTINFWINAGHSVETSKDIVAEIQRRDLSFFIKKYGEDTGYIKYTEMISKRNLTWFSRPEEERIKINKTKGKTFDELVAIHGELKAIEIIKSKTTNCCSVSKESMEFFIELDSLLGHNANKSVTGYKGPERFIVYDKKIMFVDYYLDGKIIEYNGSFWHADDRLFSKTDIHPILCIPCKDIQIRDQTRIDILNKLNYKVLTLWSYDVNIDKTAQLNKAFNFLMDF